ncbi:CD109-like protein [Mya arenaria]|uniref:CD109-like protein n=1 Tax=Mya arenaria TaxID=6604 RepID=A0ABY7ER82_MYAAR|nr:CD109-like protein [Mya arenaria]
MVPEAADYGDYRVFFMANAGGDMDENEEADIAQVEQRSQLAEAKEHNEKLDATDEKQGAGPIEAPKPAQTRKNFEETWLWEMERANSDGALMLTSKIPDSITSWTVNAFAFNAEKGIGVANPVTVTVFKEFFISMNLPYSIVRRENVTLQVLVFNYREARSDNNNGLLQAKVRLDNNNRDYQVLGPDTVELEAEGREVVKSDNLKLSDITSGQTQTASFNMSKLFPQEDRAYFVEGSLRMYLKATGDIMGPFIENLEGHIRMPTGCGEQNIQTLTPSLFAGRLTADVLKMFSLLKKEEFTYVAPEELKHMFDYMKTTVRENCDDQFFVELGELIHKEMMGGSESRIGFTAFCTMALLDYRATLPAGETRRESSGSMTPVTSYKRPSAPTCSPKHANPPVMRSAKKPSISWMPAKLGTDHQDTAVALEALSSYAYMFPDGMANFRVEAKQGSTLDIPAGVIPSTIDAQVSGSSGTAYVNSVTLEERCTKVLYNQVFEVQDPQPRSLTGIDYYQPDQNTKVFYTVSQKDIPCSDCPTTGASGIHMSASLLCALLALTLVAMRMQIF